MKISAVSSRGNLLILALCFYMHNSSGINGCINLLLGFSEEYILPFTFSALCVYV